MGGQLHRWSLLWKFWSFHFISNLNIVSSMHTDKTKQQEKADKRAAALRDNLKRRKLKAKAEKQESKESNKDGTSENEQ